MIELVGKENMDLSVKQVGRMMELLRKEEIIEQHDKEERLKERIEKERAAGNVEEQKQ